MVQPSHQDSNDSDPETGCNINGNKVETENTVTLQMKVRETIFLDNNECSPKVCSPFYLT